MAPTRVRRALTASAGCTVAGLLMIAAGVGGAWFVLRSNAPTSEVTVPELTGLPQEEALRRVTAAGLQAEIVEERSDRLVPRGQILGQEPAAGSRTRRGRTVRLVRSRGEDEIVIPDLTGRPAREARLAIQQLGLRVGAVSSAAWSDPPDRVLSQRPAPGEKRSRGDPVNLLVSRGRRPRVWLMPDLSGRPAEEARRLLETANLRVTAGRSERRDGVSSGVVLRQTPPAGSPVSERQAVTLVLSD